MKFYTIISNIIYIFFISIKEILWAIKSGWVYIIVWVKIGLDLLSRGFRIDQIYPYNGSSCTNPRTLGIKLLTNRLTYQSIQSLKPLKFLQPGHIELIFPKVRLLFLPINVPLNLQNLESNDLIIFINIFIPSMALVEVIMMKKWIVGWRSLSFYRIP